MTAYTKLDTNTGEDITSSFGQTVQTQYDCAQEEYEAGNWEKPTDIALAVTNTHKAPCPVKATATASQDGVGTDTEVIDPSTDFIAFHLDQFSYSSTMGANQSGTVKAIMSDDSEVTLLTVSTTTSGTKALKDILDVFNAKKIVYIKQIEVEVVGAAGASGVASLAATIYGYQH